MGEHRIYWTNDEKRTIAVQAVAYIKNHPGASLLEALRKAQSSMPQGRQRHVQAVTCFPWFKPMVGELLEQKKEEIKTEIRIVDKVTMIPIRLLDVPTEELTNELIARLTKNQYFHQWTLNLIAHLTQAFKQELPAIVRTIRHEKGKPKDVQTEVKRVLIVGLLGDQENEVREKFDKIFKLAFFKTGEMKTLRLQAQHADKAILMTKFISHPTQDLVKAINATTTLCHGGMTDLAAILEDYFYNGH